MLKQIHLPPPLLDSGLVPREESRAERYPVAKCVLGRTELRRSNFANDESPCKSIANLAADAYTARHTTGVDTDTTSAPAWPARERYFRHSLTREGPAVARKFGETNGCF